MNEDKKGKQDFSSQRVYEDKKGKQAARTLQAMITRSGSVLIMLTSWPAVLPPLPVMRRRRMALRKTMDDSADLSSSPILTARFHCSNTSVMVG